MFWKRKENGQQGQKLPGPKEIPEIVKKHPDFVKNIEPGTAPFLKAVIKNSEKGERTYDIRIFDPADAEARKVVVKDYNSLNDNQEMIICEGFYNEASKSADLNIKRVIPPPKLLTYQEILSQIEGLKEPGSSIFFYMSAGTGAGGPLGRGASVVKLKANTEEKKQKKYSVYGAHVVNMQPVQDMLKIFDSDKAAEVAKWIAESQRPRFC